MDKSRIKKTDLAKLIHESGLFEQLNLVDLDEIDTDEKLISIEKNDFEKQNTDGKFGDYSIEKTNFDKQKNKLRMFAEQLTTNINFDKVDTDGQLDDLLTGGLLGLLVGHKVTGDEFNKLVTTTQKCFIEINEQVREVIKEFGQVYETFEALDKGYIQGILIGVKSAERASQEAREAQKALQITVNKLKEFKDEVKSYKHLENIDEIWNDFYRLDEYVKDYFHYFDEYIKDLKNQETNFIKQIKELRQFKFKIEKYKHIKDIDEIWDDFYRLDEYAKNYFHYLDEYLKNLKCQETDLALKTEKLIAFKNNLEQSEHIKDIDKMWEELQGNQEIIQSCTLSLAEYTETQRTLNEKISEINQFVVKVQNFEQLEDKNLQLKNKLNIAYIIAGSALGVSVIQMILLLTGII